MRNFDYDIGKYITYRKKLREGAKEQEFGDSIELDDVIKNLKSAKELCNNISKREKSNLSENAKRFVHDIEKEMN